MTDPRISTSIDIALLRDHTDVRVRKTPSKKKWAMIKSTLHPSLPIAIHNYTNHVPNHKAWDPLTCAARSLVTETKTGAVVSRSFSKFFNHHELGAYQPTGDELAVVAEEKIDGSIISVFWYAGDWHAASKSQFQGPYVKLAMEILHGRYDGAIRNMDKEKTYVFELIDSRQPIGVKYAESDLVLLSIISKDAQEPEPDFDWSSLPFTRPRILDARTVELDELRKMNPLNEEGFVVKFYPSHGEYLGRPQRVKVKFDSYLTLVKAKNHVSPADILKLYISNRSDIHTAEEASVREHMTWARQKYIESLLSIADDFGGEIWIGEVGDVWDRVNKYFSAKERELWRLKGVLQAEGFPGRNATEYSKKKAFSDRLNLKDIDAGLRIPLRQWYSGASLKDQIKSFATTLPVPAELKGKEALGDVLHKVVTTVTPWRQ